MINAQLNPRIVSAIIVVLGLSTVSQISMADVQLGPRPFYLIATMDNGPLKDKLMDCRDNTFLQTEFSIGHRGAALQFPEHTRESYEAAARMGAGVLECDVTFTRDRELVCRHSQCDLHTTTNILTIPELASKCSKPFSPAVLDEKTGEVITAANAQCCTSDITLSEFRSLTGKMDASNPAALTATEFLGGTAKYRTDLYTESGTLMTHKESIALFRELGAKMTPELKAPQVPMPFEGSYTQQDYAQQLVDEYLAAGVAADDVRMQSFDLGDIEYWINNAAEFGRQAVFLDGRYSQSSFNVNDESTWSPSMTELVSRGVTVIAPPMWMLVQLNNAGDIVPSAYSLKAKEAGLDIITWTLERSGLLASGGGWYYQSISEAIDNDGDMLTLLDVLAQEVGVIGVFSDWPATVSYYANCMRLD